jgi:hypothetical protein
VHDVPWWCGKKINHVGAFTSVTISVQTRNHVWAEGVMEEVQDNVLLVWHTPILHKPLCAISKPVTLIQGIKLLRNMLKYLEYGQSRISPVRSLLYVAVHSRFLIAFTFLINNADFQAVIHMQSFVQYTHV